MGTTARRLELGGNTMQNAVFLVAGIALASLLWALNVATNEDNLLVRALSTETAALALGLVIAALLVTGVDVLSGYALSFGTGFGFVLTTQWPYAWSAPSLPKLFVTALAVGLAFAVVFGTFGVLVAWLWIRVRTHS